MMETKNLKNLVIKHFGFLEEYGFSYSADTNTYKNQALKIVVEHESGELRVLLVSEKKRISLLCAIGEFLEEEVDYPEQFFPLIFSMGDVDSRLAYDAKLLKQYAEDVLKYGE